MCFLSLGFVGARLSVTFVFVGALAFIGWSFPSSTLCGTGFVNRYCLNLVLLCNILFSSSMVIESFAGYNSLGLHV